ncbi:hypothetical protein AAC387_Pa02g1014 [Persea americana]
MKGTKLLIRKLPFERLLPTNLRLICISIAMHCALLYRIEVAKAYLGLFGDKSLCNPSSFIFYILHGQNMYLAR